MGLAKIPDFSMRRVYLNTCLINVETRKFSLIWQKNLREVSDHIVICDLVMESEKKNQGKLSLGVKIDIEFVTE